MSYLNQVSAPSEDCFVALADPTRRQIIGLLAEHDLTVNQISTHFSISRPAISKHLRLLRRSGLLIEEKRGRERLQRFNGAALGPVAEWVARYETFWRDKLSTLKSLVEEPE